MLLYKITEMSLIKNAPSDDSSLQIRDGVKVRLIVDHASVDVSGSQAQQFR